MPRPSFFEVWFYFAVPQPGSGSRLFVVWSLAGRQVGVPDIETVRKQSRVLVIDDHTFPAQARFTRDGYHFERWPSIKNLSQVTDGHWDLILLDVNGVGVAESPTLQGLGILKHVKRANPAQAVILYSAQPQMLSSSEYVVLADGVFDKGMSYLEYKDRVDDLLLRHAAPGYFLSAINRELGESVSLVPRVVPKAMRAMRTGKFDSLKIYLDSRLTDKGKVDILVAIIAAGAKTVAAIAK